MEKQEKQEQDTLRISSINNAIEMAKISSEFANKITTNVEKDIKDIQQTKSLELDIDMVNKAKNNENSDNEYSNDSIDSDDEVSFFNDARLF